MATNNYTKALPQGFASPALLSGRPDDAAILVAFSGGADSTALLHILSEYARISGAIIYAAHVNHGIRGAEADRDEQFCRELASRLGIELFVQRADVPAIAARSKESIETAARRVRYEFFDELMAKHKIEVLATAHNANDNLETLIFNIARGTGLGGMCGIPDSRPVSHGIVIRPMLAMEKSDILEYCRAHSLTFVTDNTNTDTDYARNLIRAQIVPIMQSVNSGAVRNASRMCQNLREDSRCLEEMAKQFVEAHGDGYAIELRNICNAPASTVNRALIRIYGELSGGITLEQAHVNALRELAERAVAHSSVSLPAGFEGVIENGRLCLRKKLPSMEISDYKLKLSEGQNTISQTNSEIFIGNSQNTKNIYKKETILYIDSDKIEGEIFARPRQAGDMIRMGGMNKSLKKLLCDKKIPLDIRSRLPVICDRSGIVAVPFVGVCDRTRSTSGKKKLPLKFYLY